MQVIPAQVILEDNGVRRGDPLQAKQYTESRFFGDDWYRIATWDGEETQGVNYAALDRCSNRDNIRSPKKSRV